MAFNDTSTVTLLVNGEQAESALDAMRRKADELARSLRQAQLAGDHLTTKRLQKEFDNLTGHIDDLEDSLEGVQQVMGRIAKQGQEREGIKGVYDRLRKLVGMKMPDWFSAKFPDFMQYYQGLNIQQMGDLYGQLMELSHTFKDGSGTLKIELPNGKSIEIESVDDIKGLMERLLRMIETDKHLQAQWVDEQNPRGNSGDLGRAKRRRWFSRKYYASVMNLKEFLEENVGAAFTGLIFDFARRCNNRH